MTLKHILFFAKWFPHRDDTTYGVFVKQHGLSLIPFCKISVLFVYPDDKQTQDYLLDATTEDGLFVVRVSYKNPATKWFGLRELKKMYCYFKYTRKGYTYIVRSQGEPTLHHVHVLTRTAIYPLFKKFQKKIPYVITEHWTRYLPSDNSYGGFLRKIMTKLVVREAAAVMPVSINLQKAMQAHGLLCSNYRVIPNVVNTAIFTPIKKIETNRNRLIHVSSFDDAQKNIKGLLRVIHQLETKGLLIDLVLVGDGKDRVEILAYAKKIGLSSFLYKGVLHGKELAKEIALSDALVLFSQYENLPVVILESYACGVPVMVTDVGGISEHMDITLGRMVQAGDEQGFQDCLSSFCVDKKLFDKEIIRSYALTHFSYEVIGRQINEVYNLAIGKEK